MDAPVLFILALIWIFIGIPLSKLSKAKQQQAAKTAKPGPKVPRQNQPEAVPVSEPRPLARDTVLQPSISVTEHDDTVYQGSMYAETGEGFDPCHDEQLATLTFAETAAPAAAPAEPGLQLSWTGNEIVRGFVMSEILRRK